MISQERKNYRIQPLVLTKAGLVPSLPYPLNLSFESNKLKLTDLMDGEYCINNVDNLFFWRMKDKIYTLDINALNPYISIYSQVLTAIQNSHKHYYIIPANENVIVQNNCQYLVADHLYINGSLILEGNSELVIH